MAPSSALPIGATRTVSEMQPVLVDPSQKGSGLLNAVLALLAPPHPDENERYDEEVLDLDVTGFLIVLVFVSTSCSKSLTSDRFGRRFLLYPSPHIETHWTSQIAK